MAVPNKGPVLRVTGLAASQSNDELVASLKAAINNNLTDEEKTKMVVKVVIVPSCYSDEERVALVECPGGLPAFLSELEADPLSEWQVEMGDTDISFDQHFFGFTQLYTPPDALVVAEYVQCSFSFLCRQPARCVRWCCPAADRAQQHCCHHRPRRPRVWLVARQRQPRTNVAARLSVQGSAVLPDDDLRLQCEPVEPRVGHDPGLWAEPTGGAE